MQTKSPVFSVPITSPLTALSLIRDGAKFSDIKARLQVMPGFATAWIYAVNGAEIIADYSKPASSELVQLSRWLELVSIPKGA